MNRHRFLRGRADHLTGSATDAEICIHRARCSVAAQGDGMCRTGGGATAALLFLLEDDAVSGIEFRFGDFRELLLLKCQRADRAGRAELRAEVAVVTADAAVQIERNRTGSPRRRNDDFFRAVRRAELARGAFGGEPFRILCARRQDPEPPRQFRQPGETGPDEYRAGRQPGDQYAAAQQKCPARWIDRNFRRFRPGKGEAVEVAGCDTTHAAHAALVVEDAAAGIDASRRAGGGTAAAFYALFGEVEPAGGEFRNQPELRSDRTECRAEDSPFPERERGDHEEGNEAVGEKRSEDPPEVGVGVEQQEARRPAGGKCAENDSGNCIAEQGEVGNYR